MAKVMVSLPDALLAAIDAEARRRGTTRSGLLRSYADEALSRRTSERATRIERLLDDALAPRGGDSAEAVKRLRPRA
jgi:metal-responsive CopG/Arc/MetJ family transcriptional regulator